MEGTYFFFFFAVFLTLNSLSGYFSEFLLLFFQFFSYIDTKRTFTEIFIYEEYCKIAIVVFFQTEKERFQANILSSAQVFEL